ncbi:MAG: YkgJ family cysteine cluster protein [Polyangiaceae bacterium]
MNAPRVEKRACTACGACCVAPDIAALGKALGVPCIHLGPDNLCAIYDQRPEVCRSYEADAFCDAIDAPTLEERVQKYLAFFELEPGKDDHVRLPLLKK